MNLQDFLKEHIQVVQEIPQGQEIPNWQEAIRFAANPLIKNGFIEERYIASMIKNVEDNGPYMIIVPGFAMPHSRREDGVLKTGLALLKVHNGVMFPENNEVFLIAVLAANDNNLHIDLISNLTEILGDDDKMSRLFAAKNKEEILDCI
jgi:mannitol/fructose-specific phosphotransferase system IIA component (Ntr-type)